MSVDPLTGWWGVVFDAPDAPALAEFYARLLGWKVDKSAPDWATVIADGANEYLAFQTSPEYVRPVWPPREGHQQQMLHLDIGVSDLDAAVRQAQDCGAVLADHQPQDDVRVMLDPVGHPFCLYLDSD